MASKLKSLASDSAIYGSFQIVGRFLTFMLTPLYTNYLVQGEVGDISYIYGLIAIVNIMYSLGLESSFFRFYDVEDKEKGKTVFTHAFFLILLISGLSSGLMILFANQIQVLLDLKGSPSLIRMAAAIPFFDALLLIPYAYLRMNRKAKRFASTRFILIVFAVLNNFIFVVFIRFGAHGVMLAQLIASLGGFFLLLPELKRNIVLKFDKKMFVEMIKFGLPTLPANLSAIMMQVADRPMLKAMAGSDQIAMYQVNYRLGIPMLLVITIFDYAWKPFYMKNYDDPDAKKLFARVLTYFSMVCMAVFLITSLFIEYIVKVPFIGGRFINPIYWAGLGIIPVVLGGLYINGLFSNFTAGFLITKKTKYIPIGIGSAALISITMNFILIPIYKYKAPAISLFVGYFVGAIILYLMQRKIYPTPYEWRRVFTLIGLTIATFFGAKYTTSEMTMLASFFTKIGFLCLFVVALWALKFFTKNELARIKSFLKLKKA